MRHPRASRVEQFRFALINVDGVRDDGTFA